MKSQLSVTLRQEQTINPRLYQAMDLLYMPLLDLQQYLKQELIVNPFLEVVEDQDAYEASPSDEADKKEEEEVDWEKILLDGFDSGYRSNPQEVYEYHEKVPLTQISLYDHLRKELYLLKITDRERKIGEEIIGNMNEDGYLTCDLAEVGQSVSADVGEVEAVLLVIQGFDPTGVGARNLQECMLLQLAEQDGKDSPAFLIVRDFFEQLSQHKWNEIAQQTGMSVKDVQAHADRIAQLEPKPGRIFASTEDQYVIPDIIVEKKDGDYVIYLNGGNLPRLRRSSSYYEIAKNKKIFKGEAKKFIFDKMNSANWLVQAIEQRRQTVLKVMGYIVDRQREFFDKGIGYLKPLTLREVAEAIDMHESTVSRVTNQKYCQTPRGVFKLKFFFSSGIETFDGDEVSARGIRAKISRLIEQEESSKPYTDQSIVNSLKKEGIKIARRTVAKYRDQMGILSARMRKRF
ncbi:MAG: RNA polymerase sigma-54 factor [Candidatus Glassbacteria bacterium RBG_16_58_8]|uniref:RNA polymerase sigma-54 factor n=1 Tax=Candidatus Glassbacteria bacterium RBG_16_58_8 TaxID=1817866 RepID=A0A1F5YC49_9BACT|nr:MAG: RNA polymerase sigma-54 factor [Candidatus Glassbacteria bacterium RBG_16_58_8]